MADGLRENKNLNRGDGDVAVAPFFCGAPKIVILAFPRKEKTFKPGA
ncbi:MAG: hypothetical protein AB1461_02885 [Thermodesulfobacteriota bacterium]